MIDCESMVKALRLSWLKRIFDINCNTFGKSYFNYLLKHQGGQFLLECNYSTDQIDISSSFYQELLIWWQKKEKLLTLIIVVNTLFGIIRKF